MKKKVLLFSIDAGGGHISAAQAIKDYLCNDYEIVDVSLLCDVLWPLDPLQILTLKKFTISDFYNYFARKKQYAFLNTISYACKIVMPFFAKKAQKLINQSVTTINPDIIISVIPLVNGLIARVAKKHSIPFILIPTDLDFSWFTYFFPKDTYHNGVFAISFEDPALLTNNNLASLALDTRVIGFPLRKSFFDTRDIAALKKEFDIRSKVPVVLMLMGAQGSDALYEYSKRLARFDSPLHLCICLGKHEALRAQLTALLFPSHISITLFGFTDRIADLMAVADICLSKSGSVSVCEALYMQIPLIIDNATSALQWERFNHDFIKNHGFGDVINEYDQINILLKKYLTDKAYISTIKTNISLYKKENFGNHIIALVRDMLKRQ